MFCPNCGAQIQDGSKFCGMCGRPLTSLSGVQERPPRKSNVGVIVGIVAAAIIVVAVGVFAVTRFLNVQAPSEGLTSGYATAQEVADEIGRTTEATFDSFINANGEVDMEQFVSSVEHIYDMLPPNTVDGVLAAGGFTREGLRDSLMEQSEKLDYVASYFNNVDYVFSVTLGDELTSDELSELAATLREAGETSDVVSARHLNVDCTMSVNGEESSTQIDGNYVVQIGNTWYAWDQSVISMIGSV